MTVFSLVSSVASFVKVRYLTDKAIIDNMVFRFHYKVTSAILFVCCMLVCANNLIGAPISCISDSIITERVMNTYCWITHTFTLPHQQGKPVGTHVAHPGVGTYVDGENDTRYHSYYQWVPFVLFFQGVFFYAPHWVWKNLEECKMCMITNGIRGAIIGLKEDRKDRQTRLVQYLIDTFHMDNFYAYSYYLCEVLNFINVIANIFFIDSFLGGVFFTYGIDVIWFSQQSQENRTDPMVAIFPRLTKCIFHKYGTSGTIQKYDALCMLAFNVINEKIYIFLWFWLIILAVLSMFALVYSAILITVPSIRETILTHGLRLQNPGEVSALIRNTQVGDFFLLHLLGQNLSMMMFGELLDEMSLKLMTEPSTLELSDVQSVHEETEEAISQISN